MELTIQILIFICPIWLTNISLNIYGWLKRHCQFLQRLDRPLDANKHLFDQQRVLGESTTLIGLPVALLVGAILESTTTNWKIGFLKGALVYFGHALGAFIKRRFKKADGHYLPIVDHGDYVILAGSVFYYLNLISGNIFLLSLIFTYLLHPLACLLGYKLKIRENKF